MEKIYFLSGLGSKIETTIEFSLELNKYGYEIKYIDIPGQYSNIDVNIKNEKEFLDWIKSVIPKNSLVMGYSLGADLLLKFSRFLYAKKIIILDGGIIDYDLMNITMEEDIAMMKSYIEENQLDMNSKTISKLISLLRKQYIDIFHVGLDTETLLLLSDHPDFVYEYKKNKIKVNRDNMDHIDIQFMKDTSHEIYVEKPREIAETIFDWLQRMNH